MQRPMTGDKYKFWISVWKWAKFQRRTPEVLEWLNEYKNKRFIIDYEQRHSQRTTGT